MFYAIYMATRPRARACIFHKTLSLMLYLLQVIPYQEHWKRVTKVQSYRIMIVVAFFFHVPCLYRIARPLEPFRKNFPLYGNNYNPSPQTGHNLLQAS